MGYDFTFLPIRANLELSYPARPPSEDPTDATVGAAKLVNALASFPGIRLMFGSTGFHWDAPDGGILQPSVIQVSETIALIAVDTHASWRAVLELYEHLVEIGGLRLVLWDPQANLFHDARSFRDVVEESEAHMRARS